MTTLATSIAPGNVAAQQYAVATWAAAGFLPVSLNNAVEIQALSPLYPQVRFVPVDAEKYVPFDSFLRYFQEEALPIVAICNSDVALRHNRLRAYASSRGAESLVFGNRVDVPGIGHTEGRLMVHGFDYFFFPTAWSSLYRPTIHKIGQPAWDYWVPMVVIGAQRPLDLVISQTAFHVRHPQRWSQESYERGLRELSQDFPSRVPMRNWGDYAGRIRDRIYAASRPVVLE